MACVPLNAKRIKFKFFHISSHKMLNHKRQYSLKRQFIACLYTVYILISSINIQFEWKLFNGFIEWLELANLTSRNYFFSKCGKWAGDWLEPYVIRKWSCTIDLYSSAQQMFCRIYHGLLFYLVTKMWLKIKMHFMKPMAISHFVFCVYYAKLVIPYIK